MASLRELNSGMKEDDFDDGFRYRLTQELDSLIEQSRSPSTPEPKSKGSS
jgi:hypothetical protein